MKAGMSRLPSACKCTSVPELGWLQESAIMSLTIAQNIQPIYMERTGTLEQKRIEASGLCWPSC